MDNSREEAVFGGTGLCIGLTAGLFAPMSTIAVPILGLTCTVIGMAIVAATGYRLHDRIPDRLEAIRHVQKYARVYRL